MSALARARAAVARIEERSLLRRISEAPPGSIDFASNDYLGLSRAPMVLAAMRGAPVVGSGGSRLLSGAHPEHRALERDLARFLRRERVLLFSSGYLAAIGAIQACAQVTEHAYSDESNHASLIDGLRLTKLPRTVFSHLSSPSHVPGGSPRIVVSESVFGMSGEAVDVGQLLAALGPDDLLLLDEAHALGVAGE
ncbi:MAG TPA: aminotransferase class I/II-fold pyridoxal phosphate-dependent enzyme, partial [Candidatus Baltobacteraceae bacterium]